VRCGNGGELGVGDDEDIPCIDTTTLSWCDTKTYFKYDKLVLMSFCQLS
jgi:hypothetical protein